MTYITSERLIQAFEQFSPKEYALEGDKIGLQIGSRNKIVKKVMVTLDVLEEVVDEAISQNVDFILAHHPLIFRPLKSIHTDDTSGRVIEKLIKNDITVYAAHTNLDVAKGGVNDLMAEALGLDEVEVLTQTYEDKLEKLVVFVPTDYEHAVRSALGDSGAGHIGHYSHCSFTSEGVGRFLPLEGSSPFLGEQGKVETVKEVKVETIFPKSKKRYVLEALRKAHPYEEPAFDIYPLANKGECLGLGRVGILKKEMSLKQFANHVKEAFEVDTVRVVGDLHSPIKRVALLGGDGNKYIFDAKQSGADVYVTGDLYYHVAHDAQNIGLNVIDPGHNVEKVMKQGVKHILEDYLKKNDYATTVMTSAVNTDPFQFL